jgi:hypothetical protein
MKTKVPICIILIHIVIFTYKSYAGEAVYDIKEIYKRSCKSIVTIESTIKGNIIQGSGVVYSNGYNSNSLDKDNSWIVTNAHVVNNSTDVTILYNDKRFSATVDYFDNDLDLAVLITKEILHPAESAKTQSYEIGDKVYSIGSPFGLSNSLAEGIISGKRIKNGANLIQTTAPISPGNSGGGLFDEKAQLIGVTTFKLTGGENINFAVSTTHLDDIRRAQSAALILIGLAEQLQIGISPKDIDWMTLIKWLMAKSTVNGKEKYKGVLEQFDIVANNNNFTKDDFDNMVRVQKQTLLTFLKENNINKNSTENIIKLSCSYSKGHNVVFIINLDNNLITYGNNKNKKYPAAVTDSYISWKYKLKDSNYEVVESINRFTGEIMSTAFDGTNSYSVGQGKCSLVTEKQF